MNGRILAMTGDGRHRRPVLRALAATRSEVVEASDLREAERLSAQRVFDLIVIDYEARDTTSQEFLRLLCQLASPRTHVIILAGRLEDGELSELLRSHKLAHIVARREQPDTTELLVTCEKILRGNIFGMEKYLAWGIEPEASVVRSSGDREHIIDRMRRYMDRLYLPSRLGEIACGVADEMLMNAVYNAPVDRQGRHLYRHVSRTEKVELDPGQEAMFRYGCDGRTLALAIRDPFGSLRSEVVYDHITRCLQRDGAQIDHKPGGAGMGLYFIFSSVNQLVLNLSPGRATEMIGLIDVSGTYKSYASQPKSMNLFSGEARAGG